MKKAWIVKGGWDGHEPDKVSERFARILRNEGFEVTIFDSLSALENFDELKEIDLLVPAWTGGALNWEQNFCAANAVGRYGVGLAGCHGGMCDAFRTETEWQFMTGGQWVSHPGGDGVKYTVNIKTSSSPLVEGIKDFEVCSEQYYVHVDPAIEVLATTRFPLVNYFHASNGPVDVPVVWTKRWGHGRVFYNSLGHHDDVFDKSPNAAVLMERGMLWAADGKRVVQEQGLTTERFENQAKMY